VLAGAAYLWQHRLEEPPPMPPTMGGGRDVEAEKRTVQATRWRMPTSELLETISGRSLQKFADDVRTATDGKLVITVHPAGALVPRSAVKEAVQQGSVEIGETRIWIHERDDPLYGLDALPFLVTNFTDARRLWEAQKPLLERRFASAGLIALFAIPESPHGLFAIKDVNSLADMKRMKIRALGEGPRRLTELAGAQPVALPDEELRSARERGTINAFLSNSVTGAGMGAWEWASHYVDLRMSLPKHVVLVNRAAWDSLDETTRTQIMDKATRIQLAGWSETEAQTRIALETLARNGVKVKRPLLALDAELSELGRKLLGEWLAKAGADGQSMVDTYRRM
jgi:TRAP-type C4-dicarboxylate transport system substrate-binding protein